MLTDVDCGPIYNWLHGEDAYETAGVRGRSLVLVSLGGDLIRLKRIVISWGMAENLQ